MLLTKLAIHDQIRKGNISITPLNHLQFNPNSYNLRLGSTLHVYKVDKSNFFTRMIRAILPERLSTCLGVPPSELDPRKEAASEVLKIPEKGLVLQPGTLYIGHTIERTHSPFHVPFYEGRSSTGRLGIESHVCAGFGDVGFEGQWTLEIRVSYPTRVYPRMEIGQVSFSPVIGEIIPYGDPSFRSRYQHQSGPQVYKPIEE